VGITAVIGVALLLAVSRPGAFFYDLMPGALQEAIKYAQGESSPTFWEEVQNQLKVSGLAILIATIICVPLGVIASRFRLLAVTASNAIGIARGIPSIAILFIAIPWIGVGFTPALVALTILACPPIFINTTVGFSGVDRPVVEAAEGMGMARRQVLVRIETPLALPIMLAGIRTAAIDVIASATIAAYIGYPTLGLEIEKALGGGFDATSQLIVGVFAVAAIALSAEVILSVAQRAATPPAA
jgi:osmoprotectant transport system permease protein